MSLNPKDFRPYLAELRGCACDLCHPMAYANTPYPQRVANAAALFAALQAGTHTHMDYTARAAIAQAEHNARVAAECVAGASDFRMYCLTRPVSRGRELEHFYGLGSTSLEFVIGTGLGMTPGRAAKGEAWWADRRARIDAELLAKIPALVAQDARNVCVYFRQTGTPCIHHVA